METLPNFTTDAISNQGVNLSLLVLQGSPFCNIDCQYCYLPNRSDNRRMPMHVLEKAMERVTEAGLVNAPFEVLWHAGEPLAVPVSYYEKAIEVINRFPQARDQASFVFQTNAMLLNDQWCDFFKAHRVNVGVSLDGPADVHDAHRVTRKGKGTHAEAMKGVEVLKRNGISFGVISVVSESSLNRVDDIFDFFLNLGAGGIAFNIEEVEGANCTTSLSAAGSEQRVREFFSRFYQLNREHGFPLRVREFSDARNRYLSNESFWNNETQPFSMINVDCDGNFSTFSPEMLGQSADEYGSFNFGNVMTDAIFDAKDNPVFQKVVSDIEAGNSRCAQTCRYYRYCCGASPTNKYFENKTFDSTETMHCRAVIQAPLDIVRLDIEENGIWSQPIDTLQEGTPTPLPDSIETNLTDSNIT